MGSERIRSLPTDIINFLPDATIAIDIDGKVIAWNKAAEIITGVKAEEMLGKDNREYSMVFYGYKRPILVDLVLVPDEATEKRYKIFKKDNNIINAEGIGKINYGKKEAYMWGLATALYDNDGNLFGAIESFRDITKRKHYEYVLKNSERRFADIINFLPDATFVIDKKGRVVAWNKSMEELTGEKADNMIGKSDYEYSIFFYEYRRPLLSDLVINYDHNVAKQYVNCTYEGRCLIGETKAYTKGRMVYLWGKATPLYDSKNKVIGSIESIRDITNIKQTENELKKSNEKYYKLIQNSSDAIFLVDAESEIILEVNKEAEKLTGKPSSKLVGKHFTILHSPNQWKKYKKIFFHSANLKDRDLKFEDDLYLINKEGSKIPVEIRASTIEIGGRKIIQGIIRDITDRKQKEKEVVKREVDQATKNTQKKLSYLKNFVTQQMGLNEIKFHSECIKQIYQQSQKYYQNRSIPVLIQGETGTGKEIIAKLIHFGNMEEIEKPFIDLNCAAISPSLFESELFGYEAGSYTGGLSKGQKGKMDIANGGTLFLDEIAELPLELQSKLLRVIQEKEFYRVGGLKKVKCDARIICATNVDLGKAVEEGEFRKDLYFRLKVGFIYIPPLRERKDDILPLTKSFLDEFSRQRGKHFKEIDPLAAEILLSYRWPGNVRELRNVIEWVVLMHNDKILKPTHLDFITDDLVDRKLIKELDFDSKYHLYNSKNKPFKNLIDELLFKTLEINKGNIAKTSRALGISRTTLYKKIKEYNLKKCT